MGDGTDPTMCSPSYPHFDPTTTGTDPVVCVDWCDAKAYCAWSGKRLCGRIGGGASSMGDVVDANANQWFGACSNGATTPFPYGDAFDETTCNLGPDVAAVGTTAGCHGEASLAGLFDMSGNVREWVDDCQMFADSLNCKCRGGSFGNDPTTTVAAETSACGQPFSLDGGVVGTEIMLDRVDYGRPITGFRCCAD